MADNPLLLVEGKSDSYVLRDLLRKHNFIVVENENGQEKEIVIKPLDGLDKLLRSLEQTIKVAENNLAVVVDADDINIENRWRSLSDRLKRAGYSKIPLKPDLEGTIIEDKELPKLGIWIMPNNKTGGKIENFLENLVPDNLQNLWTFAEETIENLPQTLFKTKDKIKAQIHSFLAWQEKPGISMNVAIQANYFQHDKPEAKVFVVWIKKVFDL